MLFLLTFIAAAAVAPAGHYPRPLSNTEKAVIVGKADELLFDGPSARWRWPQKLNNKDAYCGYVNAKNRLGAYTGWKPFYYGLNSFGIVDEDGEEGSSGRVMYELICGVGGYIPKPEWLLKADREGSAKAPAH